MIEKSSESLRKIRNTARFMLGNISDFDHTREALVYDELSPLDKLMLHRAAVFLEESKVRVSTLHFVFCLLLILPMGL